MPSKYNLTNVSVSYLRKGKGKPKSGSVPPISKKTRWSKINPFDQRRLKRLFKKNLIELVLSTQGRHLTPNEKITARRDGQIFMKREFPGVADFDMNYYMSIPIKHVSAALALAQRGRNEIQSNGMVFSQNKPADAFQTALRVGFDPVIGNEAFITNHMRGEDRTFKKRGEYGRKILKNGTHVYTSKNSGHVLFGATRNNRRASRPPSSTNHAIISGISEEAVQRIAQTLRSENERVNRTLLRMNSIPNSLQRHIAHLHKKRYNNGNIKNSFKHSNK